MRLVKPISILVTLLFAASTLWAAQKAGPIVRADRPAAKQGKRAPDQARPDWWGRNPNKPQSNVKGIVESVSPTSIAVKTQDGVKTFVVNEQTRVMVRGARGTINDIQPGTSVGIRFRPADNGALIAVGITVPKPNARGEITSIQGNTIVLRGKDGVEHRIAVNEQTKYRSHGYIGTLADLRLGYTAMAAGKLDNNVLLADNVEFVPVVARGTVTEKRGDVVVVKTVKQQDLQLQGSPATAVLIRPRVAHNKKGTLADVQVGAPVNVGFHAGSNGPAPLLWIDVLTGQ